MAAPTTKSVSASSAGPAVPGALVYELAASLNDLIDKLETHLAKMDTDFADVTNASVDYQSSFGSAQKVSLRETGEPNAP